MTNTYDADPSASAQDAPPTAPDGEGTPSTSAQDQGKADKAAVNYRMGNPMVNCGLCGYFQSKEHKCEVVDEAGDPIPGEISAYGLCDTYQKQDNPFLPGQQSSFEETESPQEDAAPAEEPEGPRLQIGNRSY